MKIFMRKLLEGFLPKSPPKQSHLTLVPQQNGSTAHSSVEQSGVIVVDRDRLPSELKAADVYFGDPIPHGVALTVPNEGDTIHYNNGDVRLVTKVDYVTMKFDSIEISLCGHQIDDALNGPVGKVRKATRSFSSDKAKFDKLVDTRYHSKRRTPKSKFAVKGRAKLSTMSREGSEKGFVQFPD